MTNKKIVIPICIILTLSLTDCSSMFRSMKRKRDQNYEEGLDLYKKKEYAEAQKKFKVVVSIDPEYKRAETYLKRSITYQKRKEQQQKWREQKRQNYLTKQYNLGLVYTKKQNYEKALDIFLDIYNIEPEFEDVEDRIDDCRDELEWKYKRLINTAKEQLDKRQLKEANRTLQAAKRYNPDGREIRSLGKGIEKKLADQTKPLKETAEKYIEQNNYNKAEIQLKKVLEIDPWDEEAKSMLKTAQRMKSIDELYEKGMRYYRKKDYYTAYLTLHSVNAKANGYKNTPDHLDRLKVLLKKNVNLYYKRGLKYYEQEKFNSAIREWDKVLMIEPGHEKARQYRERAEAKLDMKKSLGG